MLFQNVNVTGAADPQPSFTCIPGECEPMPRAFPGALKPERINHRFVFIARDGRVKDYPRGKDAALKKLEVNVPPVTDARKLVREIDVAR